MEQNDTQNQGYLRTINQKAILKYLRRGKLCCADLAKRLSLSNTAIGKIIDNLIDKGIVVKNNLLSRRNNMIEINHKAGVVIAVNLSGSEFCVCLINFNGQIQIKQKFTNDTSLISSATIDKVIALIQEVHLNYGNSLPLLCICICAPLKINTNSEEIIYSTKFDVCKPLKLKEKFSESFDCKIVIDNDVFLALEGERRYSLSLKNVKNALMLDIGDTANISLMLNGKIYLGNNGLVGDISRNEINTSVEKTSVLMPQILNNLNSLSLQGIRTILLNEMILGKKTVLSDLAPDYRITHENILYAYYENDSLVNTVVNEVAIIWARNIQNWARLLDISTVIINGEIAKYGENFLSSINQYLRETENLTDIKVQYAEFNQDSPLMGAINVAIKSAAEILLQR